MLDTTHGHAATFATPTSWYVMERMRVTYDDATTALGSILPVSAIEVASGGQLVVDTIRHARPGAIEGVLGRLRCGSLPWQSVAVEVEIEPWSGDESVIAVRPAARPPRAGADRYFAASRSVLRALRDELVASCAPRLAVPVDIRAVAPAVEQRLAS